MVLKVSYQVTEDFFGAMHVKHLFIHQKHTISQQGKNNNNFKSNDIEISRRGFRGNVNCCTILLKNKLCAIVHYPRDN